MQQKVERDTSVYQHEARKKSWRQKPQFLKWPFEVDSKSESIPRDSLLNCPFYFIFTAWSESFSVCSKHFLNAVSKVRKQKSQYKGSFTYLDDFLHTGGADHVCVRVEADLVDYGAVTLQDHESSVNNTTRASLKEKLC